MSRALQWKEFQKGVKEQLDKMQLKSQEQEILTRSGRIFTSFGESQEVSKTEFEIKKTWAQDIHKVISLYIMLSAYFFLLPSSC